MSDRPIRVSTDVHRQISELAQLEGCTMGEVVERAVALYRKEQSRQPYPGRRRRLKVHAVTFTRGTEQPR